MNLYIILLSESITCIQFIQTPIKLMVLCIMLTSKSLVLKYFGLCEPSFSRFKSYLNCTYPCVQRFGIKFNAFIASSGIPEDGHLSSLLFSLIINSFYRGLNCSPFLCYVNDNKLYVPVSTIDDS